MGDTPTPVNGAAKTVSSIINVAIMDVALTAFEAAEKSALPWLNTPIISQVSDFIDKEAFELLAQVLAQAGVNLTIDLQTDAEKSAYATAEAELRSAHLSGDTNALNKATADFKTALANLVYFDGSYSG